MSHAISDVGDHSIEISVNRHLAGPENRPVPARPNGYASFLSYDQAKRQSKFPEQFGKGHPEGIIAAESANNSLIGGALIPMLTLGVPGEAATAVLMGGLMIQGVRPGPTLFTDQAPIVYGIFLAFFIVNIFMILIQTFGIRLFVKILQVPRKQLTCLILTLCFVGVYGVEGNVFDIYLMLGFGVLGFFMNRFGFGTAPVILGLILGPIAETNLRRGLQVFEGDFTPFLTRPISAVFLLLALGFVMWTVRSHHRTKTAGAQQLMH